MKYCLLFYYYYIIFCSKIYFFCFISFSKFLNCNIFKIIYYSTSWSQSYFSISAPPTLFYTFYIYIIFTFWFWWLKRNTNAFFGIQRWLISLSSIIPSISCVSSKFPIFWNYFRTKRCFLFLFLILLFYFYQILFLFLFHLNFLKHIYILYQDLLLIPILTY